MKEHRQIDISSTLEHIVGEVREIKKTIISLSVEKTAKVNKTWKDLISVSDRVTKLWKGPSAVEEIRQQREKEW